MRHTDKQNYCPPQLIVYGVLVSAPLCESLEGDEIESYSGPVSITFGSDD